MPKFYVSFDLGMEVYADNEDEAKELLKDEIEYRLHADSYGNIDVEEIEENED